MEFMYSDDEDEADAYGDLATAEDNLELFRQEVEKKKLKLKEIRRTSTFQQM